MKKVKITKEHYEEFIFYIMLGVIIGGRLGYVLIYNFSYYLSKPWEIILPFAVEGGKFVFTGIAGMSFHGGALGVIVAALIFTRRYQYKFMQLADPAMPFVALGLGFGRIGNFLNAELYGRVTSLPWGMIFPGSDGQPRHPSQLYEALCEGFLMAAILFYLLKKAKKSGTVFWSFIGLYGIFRFFIEFFREPDAQLGLVLGFMSMGQILCSLMMIAALIGIFYRDIFFRHSK